MIDKCIFPLERFQTVPIRTNVGRKFGMYGSDVVLEIVSSVKGFLALSAGQRNF